MANESVNTQPASSSPPSSSSSAADSYIGSFISLTSKYEIRYEGVLYFLNPQDSTLGLKNVKSYGTEGRKKDGPQIPPSDKVYEYILFRGSDIKDLQVKASRPPPVEEPIHNDPAIIQSQSVSGHSSSSKSPMPFSGGSLTEMSPYVEASALNMRSYPSALPSRQSGVHIVEQNPPQMTQSANLLSYAAPTNWQGYNEATTGNAYAQKHHLSAATSLPSLPNFSEASPVTVPMAFPLTSSSVSLPSIPFPTASNPVYPNIISSQSPQPLVAPPMDVHSLSLKSALSAQANVGSANPLNFSSFPPSAENANKIEASNTGKVFFNPVSLHTVQSLSHSASSVVDSSVGPMLRQTPILLTPDQLSPRLPDYNPQILYPNQKDMVVLNAAPSGSLSSVTDPVNQAPLLPLESAGQQFTEEFDFEAMNEKFKKDEVWGYLGKGKQKDTAGTVQDNTTSQTSREVVGDSLTVENDSKPAYNKDDFFDSISCNTTINRSRNGQTRFSERMKLDTETFGQFQQRTHPVYGGYGPGPGHGMNRTQYGWGRGYNSGNRVRGGYMRY